MSNRQLRNFAVKMLAPLFPARSFFDGSLWVFCYHDVTDNPSLFSAQHQLSVGKGLFEQQMEMLLDNFNVIHPSQLLTGDYQTPAALVTFDDGFQSYFRNALPVLVKKGIPSLLFLNMAPIAGDIFWAGLVTYLVDHDEKFRRLLRTHFPDAQKEFLYLYGGIDLVLRYAGEQEGLGDIVREYCAPFASVHDLESVSGESLVSFGNHLFNHYNVLFLSESQLREEYTRNEAELRKYANYIPFFSYPFGQPGLCFQEHHTSLIFSMGAKAVFSSSGNINHPGAVHSYDRIGMSQNTSSLDDLIAEQRKQKIRQICNRTIPYRRTAQPCVRPRVLIVYSRSRLKTLLAEKPEEFLAKACYFSCDGAAAGILSMLDALGVKQIHPETYSRQQQELFLQDYLEAMGKLAAQNIGNPYWWASHIASKTRFDATSAPMLGVLDAFAKILDLLARTSAEGTNLILVAPPWTLVGALRKTVKESGRALAILSNPWDRGAALLLSQFRTWKSVFGEVLESIIRIAEVRMHFGRRKPDIPSGQPVYLIKSFSYESSFQENGEYHDPFMGRLSDFALKNRQGENVLTVTLSFKNRKSLYKKMRKHGGSRVVPLELFLCYYDILLVVIDLFRNRLFRPFMVPEGIRFFGHDVSVLFAECLLFGGWKISVFQFLHKWAADRIAGEYSLSACVLTYEGLPWERMFIRGLRKGSRNPGMRIYSYQHTVIPLAAAGIFHSLLEVENGLPVPDKILTTGEIPLALLQRLTCFPRGKYLVAGTLRYAYLYGLKMTDRPAEGEKTPCLLVALEGVKEVLPLVRYILQQARRHPQIRFCVRAHPVFPFSDYLKMLGPEIELPGNIELSTGKSVSDDVLRNHAVLYWGTTISMEALMMGRPVIHFDRGDCISYDPLFDLDVFKWTVCAGDNIGPVLDEIACLSDVEYRSGQETGRQYVEKYFQLPDDRSMAFFLPQDAAEK